MLQNTHWREHNLRHTMSFTCFEYLPQNINDSGVQDSVRLGKIDSSSGELSPQNLTTTWAWRTQLLSVHESADWGEYVSSFRPFDLEHQERLFLERGLSYWDSADLGRFDREISTENIIEQIWLKQTVYCNIRFPSWWDSCWYYCASLPRSRVSI